MESFENPPVQEKKEFFYPEVEYGEESALEVFHRLLIAKDVELLELVNSNDRETLQWLTMTFNHPEREESVFLNIKENKDYITEDTRKIQKRLFEILSKYEIEDSSMVKSKESELKVNEYSERVKKIIEYFKPIDLQSKVQRVIKVDADNIVDDSQQGWAIKIGKDAFILSHSTNKDNFDHEFMHTFINSIIDKLSDKFSENEKHQIMEIIDPRLKENYGNDFKSCLCEVIVRTYNDYFKRDSEKYVGGLGYESNNRTYNLYQKYSNQDKDKSVDFETFLLNNKDFLLN